MIKTLLNFFNLGVNDYSKIGRYFKEISLSYYPSITEEMIVRFIFFPIVSYRSYENQT